MNKIGIMGGTFNPVHSGHISIALQFKEQMKLDKVIFVPANISPFKTNAVNQADPVAMKAFDDLTAHRIEMLKLALADYPDFSFDLYETQRGGISYSINTVRYFKSKYIFSILNLLIGDDQAKEFVKWKDWKEIMNLAQLCIAKRSLKNHEPHFKDSIEKLLYESGRKYYWINNELIDISSETIRKNVHSDKKIANFLNPQVYKYIQKNKLYLD